MDDATLAALDHAASALIDALANVDEVRQQLRESLRGNLKPAPFFLNSASTAAILTGRPSQLVAAVPIGATKLVDRPRASEDPRLARANDDGVPFALETQADDIDAAQAAEEQLRLPVSPLPHVAGDAAGQTNSETNKHLGGGVRVDIDAEVWGCFIDAYLRPELPALPMAYRMATNFAVTAGLPIPSMPTFRRRLAELEIDRAPAPRGFPKGQKQPPRIKNTAGSGATVARSTEESPALPQESAPVSSGESHGSSAGSNPVPANPIVSFPPEPPRLERSLARRNRRGTVKLSKAERLEIMRDAVERSANVAPSCGVKFADALRAQPTKKIAPVKPPRPLQHAESREECRLCGVPGWKGCDHQLPYEPAEAAHG